MTCSSYETNGTFENDIMALYSELEPLYKELHTYVRRKLYNIYGEVKSQLNPNISGLLCYNIISCNCNLDNLKNM